MSWFDKLVPDQIRPESAGASRVPQGLWVKCQGCEAILYRAELVKSQEVCPKCSYHLRIGARARLDGFLDKDDRQELATEVTPLDPLKFRDSKRYKDRLLIAQKNTGETDALIAMRGKLNGLPVVAVAFNFQFMGGSMGSVVGERFTRAAEYCLKHELPLICFSASGGARMQEALLSLMQMAKTSAALAQLRSRGLPYISVMTDPTTGGVSASLAMLGDLNVAEPGALIGFAGRRVIEQTVRETLPDGFQSAEFLLEHGQLDMIVDRREMRDRLHSILKILLRKS